MLASTLIFIAALALAGAQDPPPIPICNCGAFITLDEAEKEIHRLPPIDGFNCEDNRECRQACRAEWNRITNNGDLDHELENGYSVGEELCIGLNNGHGIDSCEWEPVYVYSNTCDGPWEWDGETSAQDLCCHEGRHVNCDDLPPPP